MNFLEIIGITALCYLGLCIIIYSVQELFFFHPEKLPLNFKYKFKYPFEEIHLDTDDGAILNGLHFKMPNSKGVVFYFKGNTRSIKGWGKFSRDFLSKGYDFFVFDYRGFGKSRGKRSEKNFHADCQVAYNFLLRRYKEKNIIIYGRSIGSGFAASIAGRNNPKKLILDSPYYSMYHLVKRFFPFIPAMSLLKYHIRTDQFIPNVKCPIYIIHGVKDRLIPYHHAANLAKKNKRTNLIRIKEGGHNNLPKFADYHHVVYEILNDTYGETSFYDELY
ncbi:MAG: alpha/beta hydrolase [Chitinophagales bacterium]